MAKGTCSASAALFAWLIDSLRSSCAIRACSWSSATASAWSGASGGKQGAMLLTPNDWIVKSDLAGVHLLHGGVLVVQTHGIFEIDELGHGRRWATRLEGFA
eukprot:scaffold845_cov231-Pinguiococcus_pyrenoidosus.AAC.15